MFPLFNFVALPFRDASGVDEVGLRGRGDLLIVFRGGKSM